MKIQIRPAVPEDALDIAKIYTVSWKSAYRGMVPQAYLDQLNADQWFSRLRKDLSEGTLKSEVLLVDGVPAGAVGYGKSRDKHLPEWGEIVSIYVHPNFFRKGYGVKLLREAVKDLRHEGFSNCFLWVLDENTNAQGFYSAMGFQKTEDICHSEIMGKQLTEIRYILQRSIDCP